MRSLNVFMLVVFVLASFSFASSNGGNAYAQAVTCGECVTCPVVNSVLADGPSCIGGQCRLPMLKLVQKNAVKEKAPRVAPLCNVIKELTHPIKTICKRRPAGQRWINKCGRRGPRRFAQRIRAWRPFAHKEK